MKNPAAMWGSFICQNISLLLIFSLPRVKRKETIKTRKPIIAAQKMGVPEDGISMIQESKKTRPYCQIKR
jgi:hypothetical protein